MESHVASGHGFINRSGIAKIANRPLARQSLDIAEIAGGPHQESQVCSALRQFTGHVSTNETGRAGHESFQPMVRSVVPRLLSDSRDIDFVYAVRAITGKYCRYMQYIR